MADADFRKAEAMRVGEYVWKTNLNGLFYIEKPVQEDERGFFREVSVLNDLKDLTGQEFNLAQVNHSRSVKNVIRGMHGEGWNKLVTVVSGVAFSALVDIRPDSSTFGKKCYFRLGFGEGALPGALYISVGIANSICAISEQVDYVYFVDKTYADRDKRFDRALDPFDEDLAIEWPVSREAAILSQRDREAVSFRAMFPERK